MGRKVVIITGASRGIGRAISLKLLELNAHVLLVARSEEALQEIQKQHKERVQILPGDLDDLTLGQKAVDLAVATWGQLDGVIINHGKLEPCDRIIDANLEAWQKAFNVNVFSAVSIIKAALPSLRKSNGAVVLTSSGASVKSYSTWGSYSIAKASLNSLARTLAKEEPGVTTLAIRPGVVDTEMIDSIITSHSKGMDKADAERFAALRAENKLLRAEQPGNVMARLVLNAPNDLNGQFLEWNSTELSKYQD